MPPAKAERLPNLRMIIKLRILFPIIIMKLKYQNPVKGDLAFQEVLKVKVLVAQLCPTLCNPMDCSLPGLFIHGISRQYWSELPFSSPGDLSDAEIEPVSPALQADSDSFFTSSTTCCCCCVTSVVSDSVRPHRRQNQE